MERSIFSTATKPHLIHCEANRRMAGVKSQKGPKHFSSIGYLELLGTHLGGIGQVEGDSVQDLVPGGQELAQVGGDRGQDDSVGSQ